MEARSRRVGGGFPGYNGPALPRAMRSSRGRGESARRTAGYGGRSGFFELLATVAGQILQEDSIGEEQEMLKLSERSNLKQKISEPVDNYARDSELPERAEVGEKLQRESSSTLVSCLESLGEAIRSDEEKKHLLEENNNGDIGADSVHSVVSKAFLSRPPHDERHRTLLENLTSFNAESHCEAINIAEQKACEIDKQMTSSVSDNDENQTKSDPDSSISTVIKCTKEISDSKLWVDVMETIESMQTPKTEESGHDGKDLDDDKGDVSGFGGHGQTSDMDVDLPKSSISKHGLDCDVQDPISSIVTDVTKAELSSGEVTHLHGDLKEDADLILDLVGTKKLPVHKVRCEDDIKPWKGTKFYGKDDDGESGLEVDDDKSTYAAKKLLKVTDVILGKLKQKDSGGERSFLSDLILGNPRERISSKDGNCASSKQVLTDEVAKKLKDSYVKGIRARKVVKMVKRGRVSSCRSKRKHNEMNGSADSDEGLMKKSYYSGLSYTRQRTSRGFPAKRKKMADGSPTPSPSLHVNTSNLVDVGFECAEGEPPAAAAKLRSAKAASVASSPKGCSTKMCKKAGESHVKFTIKSFTVPELSVDLPESATVSSLKRAVMDAAMNLLGGGLRVRVLLQGKKVPDECATLAQVGISRTAKPDSLGFMLEPSPTSPTSTSEDPLLVLSHAAGQPSPRFPVFGATGAASGGDMSSRCAKTRPSKSNGGPTDGDIYGTTLSGDQIEGKRGGLAFPVNQEDGTKGCTGSKPKGGLNERMPLSPHSSRVAAAGALAAIRAQADAIRRSSKNESEPTAPVSHESMMSGSGAIILHPSMNVGENIQGLALVPLRQKTHSLDVGKRRVRRPFSVAEVEALVHAVEKLGTGRWRDVKLRAFDQAKHRTYVDLKDKWKTLVHTARIAPHQRRGEPVPQELLERVTRAHTYWTAQAAKQQAELDY